MCTCAISLFVIHSPGGDKESITQLPKSWVVCMTIGVIGDGGSGRPDPHFLK